MRARAQERERGERGMGEIGEIGERGFCAEGKYVAIILRAQRMVLMLYTVSVTKKFYWVTHRSC